MVPYLEHVFNLNLSYNQLSDHSLDTILRNKQHLYKLRIINLGHNRLTPDRTDVKVKAKHEEIKKMGILVAL